MDPLTYVGIVHGDIKQENVLVFPKVRSVAHSEKDGDNSISQTPWIAKVIDFGYSCFGTSEIQKVQLARTRPWQAPEHRPNQYFTLGEAKKMDVYSFGMLVLRTFLSDAMSSSIGKIRRHGRVEDAYQLLDEIDSMKATDQFLRLAKNALASSSALPESIQKVLADIFQLSLQSDPQARAQNLNPIVKIFESYTVMLVLRSYAFLPSLTIRTGSPQLTQKLCP